VPSSHFGEPDLLARIFHVGLGGSYGEDQVRIYAYGGVMGREEEWRLVADDWYAVLAPYQLTHLHMKNLRGWEQSSRSQLLNSLTDVVLRRNLAAVCWAAQDSLFEQDANRARRARELFVTLVTQITNVAPPDVHLALICDREADLAKEVLLWIDAVARSNKPLYDRISGICYMNSRDLTAVQAADMVAYLCREDAERYAADPSSPVDLILERLTQGRWRRQRV